MVIDEECYVAFLDILGFKDIVSRKELKYIKSIFNIIKNTRKNIIKENKGVDNEFDKVVDNTYIRIMSDSIVIAIPMRFSNSLAFLCDCCRNIQATLLSEGIILRGGIAAGEFYGEEEIMFGKGLVSAYGLESVAEYPRIIISPKLVHDYLEKVGMETDIYVTDFILMSKVDEYYFVDYMSVYFVLFDIKKLFEFIISNVQDGMKTSNVRKKYLWLKNYYNRSVELCYKYFEIDEKYIDINMTGVEVV